MACTPLQLVGGGVKNFRKIFAGGSEIFILVGAYVVGGGGGVVGHVILK